MMVDVNGVKNWLNNTCQIQVPDDWLQACLEWIKEENSAMPLLQSQLNTMVYEQWLMTDLRELNISTLPANIATDDKFFLKGCFCLQIDSLLDVSQPYYSQIQKHKGTENANIQVSATQHTQAPWEAKPTRMLMLKMTDGIVDVQGIEWKPVPELKQNLAPGIKIRVHGCVLCRKGVLFLSADNVQILGGEVDALVEANTHINVLESALGETQEGAGRDIREEFQGRQLLSGKQQKQSGPHSNANASNSFNNNNSTGVNINYTAGNFYSSVNTSLTNRTQSSFQPPRSPSQPPLKQLIVHPVQIPHQRSAVQPFQNRVGVNQSNQIISRNQAPTDDFADDFFDDMDPDELNDMEEEWQAEMADPLDPSDHTEPSHHNTHLQTSNFSRVPTPVRPQRHSVYNNKPSCASNNSRLKSESYAENRLSSRVRDVPSNVGSTPSTFISRSNISDSGLEVSDRTNTGIYVNSVLPLNSSNSSRDIVSQFNSNIKIKTSALSTIEPLRPNGSKNMSNSSIVCESQFNSNSINSNIHSSDARTASPSGFLRTPSSASQNVNNRLNNFNNKVSEIKPPASFSVDFDNNDFFDDMDDDDFELPSFSSSTRQSGEHRQPWCSTQISVKQTLQQSTMSHVSSLNAQTSQFNDSKTSKLTKRKSAESQLTMIGNSDSIMRNLPNNNNNFVIPREIGLSKQTEADSILHDADHFNRSNEWERTVAPIIAQGLKVTTDTKAEPLAKRVKAEMPDDVMIADSLSKLGTNACSEDCISLSILQNLANKEGTYKAKALVATLLSSLNNGDGLMWSLAWRLQCDGIKLDVNVSDTLLTQMIGFSATDSVVVRERVASGAQGDKVKALQLQKCLNTFQQTVKEMSKVPCIFEMNFSAANDRPTVIAIWPISKDKI